MLCKALCLGRISITIPQGCLERTNNPLTSRICGFQRSSLPSSFLLVDQLSDDSFRSILRVKHDSSCVAYCERLLVDHFFLVTRHEPVCVRGGVSVETFPFEKIPSVL